MKLRVLSIGKDRQKLHEPIVQEYAARIDRYQPFAMEVVGESQGDDAAARLAEAALLRRRLRVRDVAVALDERGETLTSPGLAARIQEMERSGGRDVAFLLGGASGLDPTLRAECGWALSLSRLTLPHQLARLVLVEQLYRALTILRGEPYHK